MTPHSAGDAPQSDSNALLLYKPLAKGVDLSKTWTQRGEGELRSLLVGGGDMYGSGIPIGLSQSTRALSER
jgi:hypothetical protein